MQRTKTFLVLSLGVIFGCTENESPNEANESAMSSERDAAAGKADCDARAIQDRASELVHDAAACKEDGDCQLTEIDGACLDAFLCSVPVSKSADLAQLRAEAATLSAKYKQCPGLSCAQTSCAGPFAAKCDQSSHLCKWVKQ